MGDCAAAGFGRYFVIVVGSLAAVGALLEIPTGSTFTQVSRRRGRLGDLMST